MNAVVSVRFGPHNGVRVRLGLFWPLATRVWLSYTRIQRVDLSGICWSRQGSEISATALIFGPMVMASTSAGPVIGVM
jgi:hypothetical protein